MPNKLKDLKITSTDLVNQGANPDAHIQLFKRKDDTGDGAETDTLIKKIVDGITNPFIRTVPIAESPGHYV